MNGHWEDISFELIKCLYLQKDFLGIFSCKNTWNMQAFF